MKTTFEHKYTIGDSVWIRFGEKNLGMTVVSIICTTELKDKFGSNNRETIDNIV